MSLEKIIFYVFAALVVYAALRVITAKNPVHAVLHLVLAFFSSAGIWMLLEAEFLAIALVLVYVGAVMVLFLFVVMMLDVNIAALREGFAGYAPIGILIAGVIAAFMYMVLGKGFDDIGEATRHVADYSNTKELGRVLYTQYLYPFELAAVILLLAMVAAISLTMRKRPGLKQQNIGKQVAVKASDRLKMVDVPVETANKITKEG